MFHGVNQVFAIDLLQQLDPAVFVPVQRAVFRIDVLPRVYDDLERAAAALQGTRHDHGDRFGVAMPERLVFYIHILRLDRLSDALCGLTVLRTLLGIREPEEYRIASWVGTLFFAQFLTAPRFWNSHSDVPCPYDKVLR